MGGWLYTFHAFGLRVLRQYASELSLGYDANFTVIDIDDSLTIIRDILKKKELRLQTIPTKNVKDDL